jgi:hypothetical protein
VAGLTFRGPIDSRSITGRGLNSARIEVKPACSVSAARISIHQSGQRRPEEQSSFGAEVRIERPVKLPDEVLEILVTTDKSGTAVLNLVNDLSRFLRLSS